tara:strand:+ start:5299 stop:6027 length:729 start_codon:yes stop_codon:yes gene_type:complete
MIKFKYLIKVKFFLVYTFFYLISTGLANGKSSKNEIFFDLENGLNRRDIKVIRQYFEEKESIKIKKRFSKIIKDFPNAKWEIKNKKANLSNKNYADVKITGSKLINGKEFILESNFNYYYSFNDGKIDNGHIKNHLTTIRNDKNLVDINFSIPNNVLTGSKYEIDIILNKPLEEGIIAGGIKSHQIDSILENTIKLEPLVSGGIFKVTRAPAKPGIQIWSGIIAHPEGLISFTKTVNILQEE